MNDDNSHVPKKETYNLIFGTIPRFRSLITFASPVQHDLSQHLLTSYHSDVSKANAHYERNDPRNGVRNSVPEFDSIVMCRARVKVKSAFRTKRLRERSFSIRFRDSIRSFANVSGVNLPQSHSPVTAWRPPRGLQRQSATPLTLPSPVHHAHISHRCGTFSYVQQYGLCSR